MSAISQPHRSPPTDSWTIATRRSDCPEQCRAQIALYLFDERSAIHADTGLPRVTPQTLKKRIGALCDDRNVRVDQWSTAQAEAAGATPNRARKLTMFVCACFVLPVMFTTAAGNLWVSVGIIGVAAAAHQAFSANLYTLPSDLFPRYAVGSVIGIGGTVGAIGGMVFSKYVGYVLDALGSYTPLFVVAGAAYFLALLAIHLLSPRLERVAA